MICKDNEAGEEVIHDNSQAKTFLKSSRAFYGYLAEPSCWMSETVENRD